MSRRSSALWAAVPAVVIGLFALTSVAAMSWRPQYVTPLRNGTELLAAPHMHAETLGRFEPGTVARVRGRRVGWVLVVVDEVREAWVDRTAVASP
jgi:hypothetical protein